MNSINKAFDVMEVFLNNANKGLRLSEICELTGLNKSTANRIASILMDRGYVIQKEKRGKYSLSTKFFTAIEQIRRSKRIKEVSKTFLENLCKLVNETVILCTFDNETNVAYIIEVINSKNVLTIQSDVGARLPLYCTGAGKIYLAYMSEQQLGNYLKSVEFIKFTVHTITDHNHLRASLKMIKEEGVAYDDEEQHLGIRNVAVGIFDDKNEIIASIGVLGPHIRLTREKMSEILPHIKKCAKDISKAMED